MSGKGGFIAALDQRGGSTAAALRLYGIQDSAYSGEAEMYKLMHEMRMRIISAPPSMATRRLAPFCSSGRCTAKLGPACAGVPV